MNIAVHLFFFMLVIDAVKLEEAAAEKRYLDRLIHDGMQVVLHFSSFFCF